MIDQDRPLKVLVLNGSLKHGADPSNTEEVAEQVLAHIAEVEAIESETVRLSDKTIPPGLGLRESDDDDWPEIAGKIRAADILLIATPIWWGGRSSLTQRAIERMDAFDEDAHAGRGVLLNKIAGVVITGSEDGAQSTLAGIMEFLTFMNFTLPPQCCTYWVGEVGMDPKTDGARRRSNPAVDAMAKKTGHNLARLARLLIDNPLPDED